MSKNAQQNTKKVHKSKILKKYKTVAFYTRIW